LGEKFGPLMLAFCNLFAFFAMGTSFLTVGLTVKQFFQFDWKMPNSPAWLATVAVPLLIFLAGSKDFITTMEIAGSIAFGITGVNIVLTYWRAKRRADREPEFSLPKFKTIGSLLILMFIAGIGYAVFELLKR
jgi:amino acid permease